jgi:hypothetical protein
MILLSVFAWLCLAAARAAAEAPVGNATNMVMIPRLTVPAEVAADLRAAPWTRAARLAGFVTISGKASAQEAAMLYLFYDSSSLWAACRFEGRGRSQLKAEVKDRDGYVWRDDSADLLLSPKGSAEEYYQVVVNSAGVVYDSRSAKKDWNANVATATAIDEKGWTLVLRVPFADLGVSEPKPGDVWRANLSHNSSRPERSSWAPVYESFLEVERFGRIVFGDEQTRPIRIQTLGDQGIGFEKGECGCVHKTDAQRAEGAASLAWTQEVVTEEVKAYLRTLEDHFLLDTPHGLRSELTTAHRFAPGYFATITGWLAAH